jgi:hypothetical protein
LPTVALTAVITGADAGVFDSFVLVVEPVFAVLCVVVVDLLLIAVPAAELALGVGLALVAVVGDCWLALCVLALLLLVSAVRCKFCGFGFDVINIKTAPTIKATAAVVRLTLDVIFGNFILNTVTPSSFLNRWTDRHPSSHRNR